MSSIMWTDHRARAVGFAVFVSSWALFAATACSSKQVVQDAGGCADPCCNGVSANVDCAEHPTLTCTDKSDPCANQYGCTNGLFFSTPPSPLPASCNEGGADATVTEEASSGGDAGGGADVGPSDASAVVLDAGSTFACGDAACASGSQYCRQTMGGAPPGVDIETCESMPDGQSICDQDAAGTGCACSADAGATYFTCQVP
jgi:hypothetical protein